MNLEYEREFEVDACERDRIRLATIADEDTSMDRNYTIDLPFFVQEHEFQGIRYMYLPKMAKSKLFATPKVRSA
ncbi:hypothetical protein FJZ21_02205 [Candidatus Pacearchaeota archaeon]|nr:hypothetical protein [Candidatus Pacearchaeota archaeon]